MMGVVSSVLPDTPRRQSWLCIVKWNKYFMRGFILRNVNACVDGLLATCKKQVSFRDDSRLILNISSWVGVSPRLILAWATVLSNTTVHLETLLDKRKYPKKENIIPTEPFSHKDLLQNAKTGDHVCQESDIGHSW
jgi:hypothetical protein